MLKRASSTLVKPDKHAPAPGRIIDCKFYRALYQDAAHLSDKEIADQQPLDRFANPTEFLQYTLAKKKLPQNFNPIGYVLANPDLWGMPTDWHAVLHFLKADPKDQRSYERPFDADFYRDLYFNGQPSLSKDALHQHWHIQSSNYGSLNESLVQNGFKSRDWITGFDHQSYAVFNNLVELVHNPVQSIIHFIELGWQRQLAVSEDLEFDPIHFRGLLEKEIELTDSELYRFWIENGLLNCRLPPNEHAMLRKLSLDLPAFPKNFDWMSYLSETSQTRCLVQNKWSALEHFIDIGILSGHQLPAGVPANLISAIADRFVAAGRDREAEQIYDRLALLGPVDAKPLQHRADLALRKGFHAAALLLYRQVRELEKANFWTWVNGGEAALSLGELDLAEEWSLEGLALHPRSEKLRSLHIRVQHRRYDLAVQKHVGLLRNNVSETGIESNLNQIYASFLKAFQAQYGKFSVKLARPEGPLRIVMLANLDLPQCTFYRVSQKQEQLSKDTVHLEVFEREQTINFLSAAATADVAIFYRVAAGVEVMQCIAACHSLGVTTMYEIDDLVFDPKNFPDSLESYGNTITEEQHFELRAGVTLVQYIIRLCDVGIASTEHLAVHMRRLVRTGKTIVHRNGLSHVMSDLARGSYSNRPGSPVTIFYGSGTKAHANDFHEQLEPALVRLMEEHANVRFVACGHVDTSALALRFPSRVEYIPPQIDRDAYLSLLLNVDINVSVLSQNHFNDCKSEIKWLEAAVFCVPSVVSDVGGFQERLSDRENVLRCKPHSEDWYRTLQKLVKNPALRTRIGAAARDKALELYRPEILGGMLETALRDIAVPSSIPAAVRKKRVLLANVFFPPQAIGGATRVMRDQASVMLEKYAEQFDIGILCSNNEGANPYQIEAYSWQSAPVWSIATPQREYMDWHHYDPNVAAPTDQILNAFKPDLVNFHCIQRLTATVVERVVARRIPYMVTVHDAWWISDHQFLLDHHDRLRMPWDSEVYESAYNPHSRAASGSRRLALRRHLNAAVGVLAVSESFAEIYRRAGIGNVVAVPNGLPELPVLEAVAPQLGYVRLGHLGGITYHKGYFLLKQALKCGHYDKLTLLALDHSMAPGEVRHEIWGATSVRIIGKVPQDQVGWLYGQIDVLCAPSLWPESYGLVTREAMAYGRWVIASNRGAIGEDVIPNKNGFIVDVSDQDDLPRILAEIHARPEKYSKRPIGRPKLRKVQQQVADIVKLYEVICTGTRSSL